MIHSTIFNFVQDCPAPISLLIPIISPTLSSSSFCLSFSLLSLQRARPSPPPFPLSLFSLFRSHSLPLCSPAVTFWLVCSLIIIRTEPLMNKVTRTNCSQCFKIRESAEGNEKKWECGRLIACWRNFKEVISSTYSRMTTHRLFVFLRDKMNLLVDRARRRWASEKECGWKQRGIISRLFLALKCKFDCVKHDTHL